MNLIHQLLNIIIFRNSLYIYITVLIVMPAR